MEPKNIFNRIIHQLDQLPGIGADSELRQHIRTAIAKVIDELDLVPREEFDAQAAVLRRTREKLETLEHKLAELEQQLTGDSEH